MEEGVAELRMARKEADMAQLAVVHPLEPLFEGWQRGLAIVAHPDDLEFGAAAAIARWTGQGKQIVYCLVTSGEAGIDAMAPAQARRVREAGQCAAAAVVGVEGVGVLGQPAGGIEDGGPLRRTRRTYAGLGQAQWIRKRSWQSSAGPLVYGWGPSTARRLKSSTALPGSCGGRGCTVVGPLAAHTGKCPVCFLQHSPSRLCYDGVAHTEARAVPA